MTSILFITSPKIALQFQQEIDQITQTKDRFFNNQLVENDSRVSLYIKTIEIKKNSMTFSESGSLKGFLNIGD